MFYINKRLTFSDSRLPLEILLHRYLFWDEISILPIPISISTCSFSGAETATMLSYQFLYAERTLSW